LIASFVEAPFRSLGTDGFGRSDNRDALRRFFEIDRQNIVVAALFALAEAGTVTHDVVAAAIRRYGIETECGGQPCHRNQEFRRFRAKSRRAWT
jgi:pyruvate dehydrogenase E1 component